MEYPNHRKCCGTCANWKEPKRVISTDRTKVTTEVQKAVCQVINSAGQEMGGGCSACANICPKQCISMLADTEGFLYPHIDKSRCIDCNLCETVCNHVCAFV